MTLISASMQEFLGTGHFGTLRVGDSIDSLKHALGEPQLTGGTSRRYRSPRIWKYGDIEFHLTPDGKHIRLIFCDSYETLTLGPRASLDRWFFDGHPSAETVGHELAVAGLSFQNATAPHEPTMFLLHLQSGVELIFQGATVHRSDSSASHLLGFQLSDARRKESR